MFLIYDTETTGLPRNWNAPITDTDNWPRCVQIAWQLHDEFGNLIEHQDYLVKPDGYSIPYNAEEIHGISTELATQKGIGLREVLSLFNEALNKAEFVVGQNIGFDINVMGCEFHRLSVPSKLTELPVLDTCTEVTANLCKLPGGRGGKFKLPNLTELHEFLFNEAFGEAHNATADVEATTRCFLELVRKKVFTPEELNRTNEYLDLFTDKNVSPFDPVGIKHINLKKESDKLKAQNKEESPSTATPNVDIGNVLDKLEDIPFTHLHCHSQFSILQATSDIQSLVSTAKELGMPAIALTDHGNMMAAFQFVKACFNAEIKPIVGCEFNICSDRKDKSRQNNGFQSVLIAKNQKGYHNLVKLASSAYTEGFYYVPRIDKSILVEHKDDVIATTGGLWGEIPYLILNEGEEIAEKEFLWWKEQFGDDFYVELNRHNVKEEDIVNEVLLRFAKKHNVKYIAANNTYYTTQKEADAHDILLCVKDGNPVSQPKRYIGKRGREFRYGFPNDEFYLKSQEEMKKLFSDLPDSIVTTNEIVEKCEPYKLERDVLLPEFDIPEEFIDPRDKENPTLKNGENNFLRHLTYVGAEKRYGEITNEIKERLDFELSVIRNTGYPGYFLIVQDFTTKAREIGVSVGPGRGSAAGSAVAYCIGITNVDPIKYDLLFERFLNPERVSMPDIDIDFDDEGRQKVIDYVIDKYGSNQVAQIITYGTMAAKSSIRDTARVLELPLSEADRVAKLVPDIKLNKLFSLDDEALAGKLKNNSEEIAKANELKSLSKGSDLEAQVVNQARVLEGSVRNTGIHACGVIITPDDITNYVPVALAKDSDMYCTQFDNAVAENAGLLKMDFLGLKTLTLIKDACANVKIGHNIDLVPDDFPLDDVKTYELFQRGETVGIFQYESPGMQKYLRELKPTVFADLIAMNALYRPGPLEYIPEFIDRKHGRKPIVYDLDACEEYLEETYGITVYQEQVMLLSQKLSGFTKGQADSLRKGMGKKKKDVIDALYPLFIDGGKNNGHNEKSLNKIWKDWEAFASYAFNKSHSTCYAYIAFQTAYLKAHYPAEYMASVLSNNMGNIKDVTFFMEECKRMGIPVLGPDVNESAYKFAVNDKGEIRFGLGAIKGAGEAAVESIISERLENGPYKNLFDFGLRVNLRTVNKKTFECLAMAGGFDELDEYHRRQYLVPSDETSMTLIETLTKYAQRIQSEENSAQASLFGGDSAVEIPQPKIPPLEPYNELEKLNLERDVVGLYISGHPLDAYQIEFDNFCTCTSNEIQNYRNQNISLAGMVTSVNERITKKGKPFGLFTVEDYNGAMNMAMFGEDYLKNKHLLVNGSFLYIKGKVQERYNSPGEWEFRPSTMELLSDVRDKLCKGIAMNVEVSIIDEAFLNELDELLTMNPGNLTFKLNVVDPKENLKIEMFSRKFRISANNELIEKVSTINGTSYEIIT